MSATPKLWPCKKCGARAGDPCTNYLGKPCAFHAGRKPEQKRTKQSVFTKGRRPPLCEPGPAAVQPSLFDTDEEPSRG